MALGVHDISHAMLKRLQARQGSEQAKASVSALPHLASLSASDALSIARLEHQHCKAEMSDCVEAIDMVIERIGLVCKHFNPHFKRDRWLAYINGECGPNGGELRS